MKGRKKIPDSLKTQRGTGQPCRMSNSVAIPPTTAVVAYAREMALYHDLMRDVEHEKTTVEIEINRL